MKVSNKEREERISDFIIENLEAPYIDPTYVLFYEIEDENGDSSIMTPDELSIVATNQGLQNLTFLICGACVDLDKISKDSRRQTDKMIKKAIKAAAKKSQ